MISNEQAQDFPPTEICMLPCSYFVSFSYIRFIVVVLPQYHGGPTKSSVKVGRKLKKVEKHCSRRKHLVCSFCMTGLDLIKSY